MTPTAVVGANAMRTLRFLLLPLLLSLPLASAGGYDASVAYLEPGDSTCHASWSYDHGSHDNGTWGWSWSQSRESASCADSFSYADARVQDEDGDVVHARAGTRESSNESQTSTSRSSYDRWNGWESYHSSYHSEHHNATDEGRSAGVETREGSVGADTGCRSTQSARSYSDSSSYSYGNDGGWTDWYGGGSESWERCATSATLARDGETTTVTPWSDECRYASQSDYERSSYRWDSVNQSYEASYDDHAYSSECASGAAVSTEEGSASAGQESRCSDSSSRASGTYGNASFDRSYRSSDCVGGFVVRGPDGMVLFVGEETRSWEGCADYDGVEECYGDDSQQRYVRLSWAHSPLGPGPTTVALP